MMFSKGKRSKKSPAASPKKSIVFHDGLSVLADELQLAIKWDRPSVLLVVHKARSGQGIVQTALQRELAKLGQTIKRFELKDTSADMIPGMIRHFPRGDRTVYFFSHLGRKEKNKDGKDTYRALNLCRETFVENRIRAIFWLTLGEASDLPSFAPDFWAFRHRVVDF